MFREYKSRSNSKSSKKKELISENEDFALTVCPSDLEDEAETDGESVVDKTIELWESETESLMPGEKSVYYQGG